MQRQWRLVATRMLTLAGLLLAVVACGSSAPAPQPVGLPSASVPSEASRSTTTATPCPGSRGAGVSTTPSVPVTAPLAPATTVPINSLYDQVRMSTLIIVGECIEVGEVVNACRMPGDNSQPATDVFCVGQLYRIRVEHYVKGCGPDTLTYGDREGVITRGEDRSPQAVEAWRQARSRHLQVGSRYVLFLRELTFPAGSFGGAGYMDRWVLSEGEARPDARGQTVPPAFSIRPEAVLLRELEQYAAGALPTPTATSTPIPTADVGWVPAELRVRVGETFTVSLAIHTIVPVRGLQFGVDYDPEVVRLDEVSEGTFFGPWAVEHGQSTMIVGRPSRWMVGSVSLQSSPVATIIVFGSGDDSGPKDAGRVLELRFTALTEGASNLRLRDVKVMRGPVEQRIPANDVPVRTHDGLVTVVGGGE